MVSGWDARRERAAKRLEQFMVATVKFDDNKPGAWDPETDSKRPPQMLFVSKAHIQPIRSRVWTEDTVNPVSQRRVWIMLPKEHLSTDIKAGMGVTVVQDPTSPFLNGMRGFVEDALPETGAIERTVYAVFTLNGGV